MAVLCMPVQAATLALELSENTSGAADGEISYRIVLNSDPGEAVAAFQADLSCGTADPARCVLIAGTAIAAAQKNASFSPIGSDTLRVLVAGLNQNVIASGPVLELRLRGTGSLALEGAALTDAILADPYGHAVPVQLRNHAQAPGAANALPRGCACDAGTGPAPLRALCGDALATGATLCVLGWGAVRRRIPQSSSGSGKAVRI